MTTQTGRQPFGFLLSRKAVRVLLLMSLFLFAFWITVGLGFNVYKNPVAGAVFEILWLPMLAALFLLPLAAAIQLYKKERGRKLLPLLSLLLCLATIALFVFHHHK